MFVKSKIRLFLIVTEKVNEKLIVYIITKIKVLVHCHLKEKEKVTNLFDLPRRRRANLVASGK